LPPEITPLLETIWIFRPQNTAFKPIYETCRLRAACDRAIACPGVGAGPGAPRHQQKKARAMKLGWTNRAKSRAANRAMPAPKTAPLAPETQPTAPPRLVKLIATCAPLDIDDPQPAITILMPVED
jgi:hypothetical protein